MNDIFSRIEVSRQEGRAQSVRLRQKLFHSLHSAIKASEKAIKEAVQADTGYNDHDVNIEYSLTISELRTHYESLDLRRELDSQKAIENLDATTSVGIVYIIPARGNLFYSIVSALTAALAAGNCIILELPTTLSRISGLLRDLLTSALDADIFAISNVRLPSEALSRCYVLDQTDDGGPTLSDDESEEKDKSSPRVVAIVDRTANVPEAALTIAAARMAFNGQAAYAPELVFVNEFVADEFLRHACQAMMTPATPVLKHMGTASQHSPARRSDTYAKTLKVVSDSVHLKMVMSGDSGSVIEITDSFRKSLQASYIFAAAAEANYLSRFLDARISCINHIATELLGRPIYSEVAAPSPLFWTARALRLGSDQNHSRASRSSAPKYWANSVSTLLPGAFPVSAPPNSPDVNFEQRGPRVGTNQFITCT
ncbi:uncharacterized protein AB675_6158 [Cyphellophora attinorum]|uniref:Uncharacterized protein n=1 Tax=Cyphellophora attinorum TaxID=1664694 RepID=A0A0N1P0T9_9EURO|nr:uncharacterized protein AB675_6158 [Phialophora attinorum]KPI44044.1 hypothetical protein AB675_6158 [Phialophora attinorum]